MLLLCLFLAAVYVLTFGLLFLAAHDVKVDRRPY